MRTKLRTNADVSVNAESEDSMNHDRFKFVRSLWQLMHDEDLVKSANCKNSQAIANTKRLYRQELRKVQGEDPLRCSILCGAVRRKVGRWDEGFTEYRILQGEWTPEEIRDAIEEAWISVNSPYDCTGRLFTVDIHARQTPVGLVWIHRMGVDV